MFIHIGGEYTLFDHRIIGIFDLDQTTTYGMDTINFLRKEEEAGHLDIVSEEIPRSFILSDDRVYLSPIKAKTLLSRSDR